MCNLYIDIQIGAYGKADEPASIYARSPVRRVCALIPKQVDAPTRLSTLSIKISYANCVDKAQLHVPMHMLLTYIYFFFIILIIFKSSQNKSKARHECIYTVVPCANS